MLTTLFLLSLGVQIELPTEARVRGAELDVGSVAQVTGDDAAEVERVRAISLGYAPAPGYSRLLQVERIAREIQAQAADVELSFTGARACRVWPQLENLPGRTVQAAARSELLRRLGGRDVTLELLQPVADLSVPLGSQAADVHAHIEPSDLQPGRVNVTVQVSVDGAVWRNVITSWRLQEWQLRPVLVREVLAGETLTPALIEHRRVPVERTDTLHAGFLVGARLARSVPAGRALHAEDILREILVQRGAELFLEVRRGNVSARVRVTAEGDGARGDRIQVRLADSGRTLNATVLGRDLARIDMGTGS